MPPTDDIDVLRRKLTHADAVIAELRGVVAELRKQIESQQAHIHCLVKITFGRRGERVEGPTLFDGIVEPEPEVSTSVEPPAPEVPPVAKQKGHGRRRNCPRRTRCWRFSRPTSHRGQVRRVIAPAGPAKARAVALPLKVDMVLAAVSDRDRRGALFGDSAPLRGGLTAE